MTTLRSYLRLTRAHTAPLEAIPALVGASLATDNIYVIAAWGLYGVLYHLAGYGMNSYEDWDKGYDKDDPHKQHHPLNTGEIEPDTAYEVIVFLLLSTLMVGLILSFTNELGYLVLMSGAAGGMAYNLIGKETYLKFIFISIAHTSVFVLPYVGEGGNVYNPVFIFGAVYVFLWVVFQISVSGEVKDILQFDESNFLRDVTGTSHDPKRLEFSLTSKVYSVSLKTLNMLVGVMIIGYIWETPGLYYFLVYMIVFSSTMLMSYALVNRVEYNHWGMWVARDRKDRINIMSMIELNTLVLFLLSYLPILGTRAVATLFGMSVIWVIGFNQLEWGSILAPEV